MSASPSMFERRYKCQQCGAIYTFLRENFADKLSELPRCDADGSFMMPASRNDQDTGPRPVDVARYIRPDGWAMLVAQGDFVNHRKVDTRFIDHWNRTLPRRSEVLSGIRGDQLEPIIRLGEAIAHETRAENTELWVRFDEPITSSPVPRRAMLGAHPHTNELAVAAPKVIPYPGDREQREDLQQNDQAAPTADVPASQQIILKPGNQARVLVDPAPRAAEVAKTPPNGSAATNCFVSYSHHDAAWLRRLHVHLKPLMRQRLIDAWDDTKIKPGAEWRREIELALSQANIAILLVSADFLASEYVVNDELPPLLRKAEARGCRILSIVVSPCLFLEQADLSKYQCVNSPDRPLSQMSEHDVEDTFVRLARAIKDEVPR